MTAKTKKIINTIVNVICIILFAMALFLVVVSLTSSAKGYNVFFGKLYMPVETASMQDNTSDEWSDGSFQQGTVIVCKELATEQKSKLKVGDVVTFWDTEIVSGQKLLNTHRIVATRSNADGSILYSTKGDNNSVADHDATGNTIWRASEDIVAIYEGMSGGGGNFLIWLQSPTGFLIIVVIPSFLIVGYCVYLVVVAAREHNKEQLETEKARIREELLKEINEEKPTENDKK
ncbi:MAG: signal peptidase I [Clostridia bacterium]